MWHGAQCVADLLLAIEPDSGAGYENLTARASNFDGITQIGADTVQAR